MNLKEAFKTIEDGIKNINSNAEWQKFLMFQSRFHQYSFHNTMLIFYQRPTATCIAGFTAWKKLNRFVSKGEKAIQILAPCKYRTGDDEDSYTIRGFRTVNVFDLEQTAGDDSLLPVVITGLTGLKDTSGSSNELLYQSLIQAIEIPVSEKTDIAANGLYYPASKEITIKANISQLQKVKTLVHEYAHHLHHTKYLNKETKGEREILAESAAFIVCNHWGLDTSDYSLPYVKTWLDDPKQFKELGSKINLVASEIIALLEDPKQGSF